MSGSPTMFVARPPRLLWIPLVLVVVVGVYGAVGPLEPDASPTVRTVWVALCLVAAAAVGVPLVRGRLTLTDAGVLRKRVVRTREVDLADLVSVRARGEQPWQTVEQGVVGFEDGRGRVAEVPLAPSTWVPGGELWERLAAWIVASGQPLAGIVAAQIERYLQRTLPVHDVNRAALRATEQQLRGGRATPHRARAGGGTKRLFLLLAALLAGLLVGGARTGMVPDDQVGLWSAVFATIAVGSLLWIGLLHRRVLALTADATLTSGRRTIDLTTLAAVRLDPDQPYLELTVQGNRPNGRKLPAIVLTDDTGTRVRIALDGTWKRLTPVLRHVLAAANARNLPLSGPTRYNLEFLLGLTEPVPWDHRRS